MIRKPPKKKMKQLAPSTSRPELLPDGTDLYLRTVLWDFFSISSHLKDVRSSWAKFCHVDGPQWNILMAIDHLDRGGGVPVGAVAEKIHVKSTFVTTESRLLEMSGHVHRITSATDRRVVLLSLTEQTIRTINSFSALRQKVNDEVFGGFTAKEFAKFVQQIGAVRVGLERAAFNLTQLHIEKEREIGDGIPETQESESPFR